MIHVRCVLVALALVAGAARTVAAEHATDAKVAVAAAGPCVVRRASDPSPICFDPGNRVIVDATTVGVRVALRLRHVVVADDPTVTWRLDHTIADAAWDGGRGRGALYQLRLVRHSTDGHVMFPTSPPTRLHFPFDLGVELAVGQIDWHQPEARAEVGVFHAAPMFDLYRADDFKLRVALGASARWDVGFDLGDADGPGPMTATEHVVAPLSEGVLAVHAESRSGRTAIDLRARGGMAWSTQGGWTQVAGAEATVERVLGAVNDVPISALASGGWGDDDLGGAERRRFWGSLGLRVGLGAAR